MHGIKLTLKIKVIGKFQDIVENRGAWHATVHGIAESWTGPTTKKITI